jgi:uroporphyrinogen-III synthase
VRVLRVAVTRPKERAAKTTELVRKRGWDALIVPTIEIVPLPIDPSVSLEDYDWLVVTSASGVDVLWNHFKHELKGVNIAVIGPKTKAAFEEKDIVPKVVATEHVGEGLATDLTELVKGKKVLVARAVIARRGLVDMLKGVAEVTEIAIYDTILPRDKTELSEFRTLLENHDIDAIIFTSSQSAKNLLDFLGKDGATQLNDIIVCAIGPITAKTLKGHGVSVTCMPEEYTIDATLDEIERFIS